MNSRAAKNIALAAAKANPNRRKSYSPKMAARGKDIGKLGKAFSNIASSAAKKYGSKKAGARVAGAILKKLRAKY